MAHVGALAALREAGIPIDFVAGASAGAIMGSLFCAGMSFAEIEYIASKVGWLDLARPVWPREGFFTFAPLERLLRELLEDIDFADLETPFAAIATNLETGEPVTLCEGPVAPAVRASSSVPGVVTPCRIGPLLLGDGALANNLPVSVVRDMGADLVIAVDIFQPTYIRGWGPFGRALTALEILINRAGGGLEDADFLVQPQLAGVSYLLFSQRSRLMRLGRKAAEAEIPAIRAALNDT
jgi:NTE family protein